MSASTSLVKTFERTEIEKWRLSTGHGESRTESVLTTKGSSSGFYYMISNHPAGILENYQIMKTLNSMLAR